MGSIEWDPCQGGSLQSVEGQQYAMHASPTCVPKATARRSVGQCAPHIVGSDLNGAGYFARAQEATSTFSSTREDQWTEKSDTFDSQYFVQMLHGH